MEESSSSNSYASSEMFSFPSTPAQDFEFGSVTPEKTSPADHLFSNGRLLPHTFPSRASSLNSHVASRTSSVSSKDSFMSSRSSSRGSARASSSGDDSERRRVLNYYSKVYSDRKNSTAASRMATAQLYGAGSNRWQYITPVPGGLKRDGSGRKRKVELRGKQDGLEKKKGVRAVEWGRFFRLFLLACKECHAMEPSKKEDLLATY